MVITPPKISSPADAVNYPAADIATPRHRAEVDKSGRSPASAPGVELVTWGIDPAFRHWQTARQSRCR